MPIQGREPLQEDLEWLKYGRKTIQGSPQVLDEAAKSFLALGSSLLTVYTGALALFKLNERVSGPEIWALICAPILLWLLCISCLAYVYFPDRYRFRTKSPSDIEDVTREIARNKSFRLKVGAVLFVLALAATSFSLTWLGAQPSQEAKTPEETVQLVVAKDLGNLLRNLSLPPEDGDLRTIPLALVERGIIYES